MITDGVFWQIGTGEKSLLESKYWCQLVGPLPQNLAIVKDLRIGGFGN